MKLWELERYHPDVGATEGKRSSGRSRETWRRTKERERERQKTDFATWNEAVTAARDRADWSTLVNGPILPEE